MNELNRHLMAGSGMAKSRMFGTPGAKWPISPPETPVVKLSEVFIILERSMGFVRSGLGIHCFRLSSERFQGARIGYW